MYRVCKWLSLYFVTLVQHHPHPFKLFQIIFEVLGKVYDCGKIRYSQKDEMLRLRFKEIENQIFDDYVKILIKFSMYHKFNTTYLVSFKCE